MTGTSPFGFQSPSHHSSSYLPKLEANFMRDFTCCGLMLPNLHDLLQHYEEAHAQKPNEATHAAAQQQSTVPDTRAALATNTAMAVQKQADQQRRLEQQNNFNRPTSSGHGLPHRSSNFSSTLQTIPDMDTVDDMDMDDIEPSPHQSSPSQLFTQQPSRQSPQLPFSNAAQPQIPQLNTNMMQGHQSFRQSTPSTPVAPGRNAAPFQNNTTGQNTPTLMSNPMQQQFQNVQEATQVTPDTSLPGSPGDIDENFLGGMDGMSMQNQLFDSNLGYDYSMFGNNDMLDLCIDEPAKHLFTSNTLHQGGQQRPGHVRLGSGQYGPNSDIARRIREQQIKAGLPDTTTGILASEEPKPFRCPVIGCEKAYKNQNGLKYHKTVSVRNGRYQEDILTENSMGTTTRGYMRMVTALSLSSTQTRKHPTRVPRAWRRRNPTNVMSAKSDTRILTALSITKRIHHHVTRSFSSRGHPQPPQLVIWRGSCSAIPTLELVSRVDFWGDSGHIILTEKQDDFTSLH